MPSDPPPEDPIGLYSGLRVALFRLYLHVYFWRKFDAVRLSRTGLPAAHAGRKLVIYCNHPSWWDPALLLLALPKLFPGRRGFGPMDSAELRRYALFRRMGVFGIDPATRKGGAGFLRTGLRVLADPKHCLCVTAEGHFTDPRLRPIRLRPGLAHLARRLPDAVFLPLALEYGFWNERTPEALLRFGPPVEPGTRSIAEWQSLLEHGLTATMDALAAESATRNAALFLPLWRGTAGVGLLHDAPRGLKAALRGRRFDARHEPGQR